MIDHTCIAHGTSTGVTNTKQATKPRTSTHIVQDGAVRSLPRPMTLALALVA